MTRHLFFLYNLIFMISPASSYRRLFQFCRPLKLNCFSSYSHNNAKIDLPTNDNPQLVKIRHSAAHIMAMAVQRIFPSAKTAIGPWIDNGFYYDFDIDEQLNPSHFDKIKKEMKKIISADLPITREEVSYEEARRRIESSHEPYKLEILESLACHSTISIYHIGNIWWDLCAGPHVTTTKEVPLEAFDLTAIAGAYWRGDIKNAMLQRIYGTAWLENDQLQEFRFRQEEALRRDHRTLGKQLDLFTIQEDAGGGLVFWHPKGSVVRRLIEDIWKAEHVNAGYEILHTPHIANVKLWKTSGHLEFYKNDMFQPITVDEEEFQLKPMNCPFHCLIYKDSQRSYRDLPIRWAELGTVYRYEKSGTLHGLFRVRGFTQDDAHIFCLPEQLEDEIIKVLNLTEKILSKFGFSQFDVMLSTRPIDSVGDDDIWHKATNALKSALNRKGWSYSVDDGGGAFYGPKIDLKIRDAIGRKWQCSTVQCDFNLPERFDLTYADRDHIIRRPIMVHRAIFGSLERFFGILIENSAGDFPLWLSPIQLRLLPVVDAALPFCKEIQAIAKSRGIRVDIDGSGNRIAKQIRNCEQAKIPLSGIVGINEVNSKTISLRIRKNGQLGNFSIEDVLEKVSSSIEKNEDLHQIAHHFRLSH